MVEPSGIEPPTGRVPGSEGVRITGIDLSRGWQSCREDAEGCWARGDSRPHETWWARVRRADGREGWVREPLESLDGVLRSD